MNPLVILSGGKDALLARETLYIYIYIQVKVSRANSASLPHRRITNDSQSKPRRNVILMKFERTKDGQPLEDIFIGRKTFYALSGI